MSIAPYFASSATGFGARWQQSALHCNRLTIRRLFLFVGCTLAASSLAPLSNPACAADAARPLDRVTLQLKWHHQFQFAGYYAAVHKGFYRDVGLDVRIIQGGPRVDATREVARGHVDFGIGTSGVLLDRAHGVDVVVVAAIFQHSPSVLLVPDRAHISALNQLQHRRLMDTPGSEDIAAMLKRNGVSYAAMPRVRHSGDPRDLVRGRADAMIGYSTNEPFLLGRLGVPYKAYSPRAYNIDFYGDNIVTSQQEIDDHPARVAAFRAASLRGWQYALAHKKEIIDLILKNYSRAKTRDALGFEADQTELLIQPDLIELGYQNPAHWRAIAQTYRSLGMLKDATLPDNLIYHTEHFGIPPRLRKSFAIALLLCAAIAGFGLMMARLNRHLNAEIAERREAEQELLQARARAESTRQQMVAMSEALPLAMFQLHKRPDGSSHFAFLGSRAEQLLGIPQHELLADASVRWRNVHPDDQPTALSTLDVESGEVRATEAGRTAEMVVRIGNDESMHWLLAISYASEPLDDGTVVWNGYYRDVTNRKQVEDSLQQHRDHLEELIRQRTAELEAKTVALQQEVAERSLAQERERDRSRTLELLASGQPLNVVLQRITQAIEREDPTSMCSILLLDSDGVHLRNGASPSLPAYYIDAIESVEIGEGVGSCGTAAFTRSRVVVADMLTHPYWTPYRELVEATGLRACWSEPVMSASGEVLGTFAIYHNEVRSPDESDNERIKYAAEVMRLAIESRRVEDELRLHRDHLEDLVRERTLEVESKNEQLNTLSQAIEQSPVSVVICDPHGIIEYVNPCFVATSGFSREEVVGAAPRARDSGAHPPEFYDNIQTTLQQGGIWQGEICDRRKNGELYWQFASLAPVRLASGEISHILSVAEDITERKEAEDALRDSEAYNKMLFQESHRPIVVYDPATGGFRDCNMAAVRAYGFANRDEVLGKTPVDLSTPAQYDGTDSLTASRLHDAVALEHGADIFEWRHLRPNGEVWDAMVYLNRFHYQGRDLLQFTLDDVTERRRAEQAIRDARQAADEANRSKSDFLANMSHEIRTPMNAILGMSHLALQTDLSEQQRNYLQKIDGASRNLLGIINEILDFSKIEAGKLTLENIDFDLESTIRDLADMFVHKAQEKSLEFLFFLEPDVPTEIVGDPLRLGQVLTNLTSNAMKFTDQGEIVVRVEKLDETDGAVTLGFSVRDTGIGLSAAQRSKLFQSFSQADNSTTRKYGGTGLGLTISKRLVEMMGGEIGVESEPGKGSRFFFSAVFQKQVAVRAALHSVTALDGMRALVVDDNATSRDILQAMLESFSFEVAQAASGAEAIEDVCSAAAKPFDLVLVDLKMPGIDGIETSRRIKNEQRLEVQPAIIMVSAYGREEIVQQANEADLDGFLVKPVSPSLLLDTILQVMGKSPATRGGPAIQANDALVQAQNSLRGARILLVEDNEINQEVAREILGSAAIEVTVAGNGREGVDSLRESADSGAFFDAVLMDVQMPEMDGYQATRLIRRDARFDALPVIAMTANAMAGDREQCLAAGMNDHIAKPIDVAHLFGTLARWIKLNSAPDEPAPPPTALAPAPLHPLPAVPGLDIESGLARLGGNRAVYLRLLGKFADGQGNAAIGIEQALAGNDLELAGRLAHSLKGVAGNIGAHQVFEAARGLEEAIAQQNAARASELLPQLERILLPLVDALAKVTADEAATAPAAAVSATQQLQPSDIAAVQEQLAALRLQLDDGDTAARHSSARLHELLQHTAWHDTALTVMRLSESHEFDAALEKLHEIENDMAQ